MRRIVFVVVAVVAACSGKSSSNTEAEDGRSAWSVVGIGSVFVTKSVTRMQKPFEHQTETTTTHTLVARTDAEASVKIEITEGAKTSAVETKVPLRQDVSAPHDGSTVTKGEETCTVPAGTFSCTRTTVEVRQGDVTRSTVTWNAKKIPVPLRTIVTNENMTMTSELTTLTVK